MLIKTIIKKEHVELHQNFPTIAEFKDMVLNYNPDYCEQYMGKLHWKSEYEDLKLYYLLLGDDVAIWHQDMVTTIAQKAIVYPRKTGSFYLFQFISDQNISPHSDSGIIFDNKSLALCHSSRKHIVWHPRNYRAEFLQMIVSEEFLKEYVPTQYLNHSIVQNIFNRQNNDFLVIPYPPPYIRSELSKIISLLKRQAIPQQNKLHLLQLTARFIDLFFRIYLGSDGYSEYPYSDKNEFKNIVLNYYQKHLDKPFPGIEALASKFNLSSSTFKRTFVQCFRQTSLQLFRQLQMKKAEEMLLKGDMSVADVAYHLGFNSTSNFIRCFKKYNHRTPGSFL